MLHSTLKPCSKLGVKSTCAGAQLLSPVHHSRVQSFRCNANHASNRTHRADKHVGCPAAPSRRTSCIVRAVTDEPALVAVPGDVVMVHFICRTPEGEVLESSREVEEPLTFEVGAGEMMGNRLFQGFDEAVRGMAIGDKTELEAQGGEWSRDLLFKVPADHPEVARLQGRYKNQGGLAKGLVVELANGGMAVVLDVTEQEVVLDANNMMAGKKLIFELEMIAIKKGV